jgi:hypothetical protein
MRLPLTFVPEDVVQISRIIADEVAQAATARDLAPVPAPVAD